MKNYLKLIGLTLFSISLSSCIIEPKPVYQQPIMIFGAMDCEYEILKNSLKDCSNYKINNYDFYSGTLNDYPVVVAKTYVGFVNASISSTIGISYFNPKYVISQGTSGAHKEELNVGDIILGKKVYKVSAYESEHKDKGEGVNPLDWELMWNEAFINGKFEEIPYIESDNRLMQIAKTVKYKEGKIIKEGVISSSDAWNKELDMIERYNKTIDSDCEEMESYAIGQVSANFNVPYLAVRIISNNEITGKDFEAQAGYDCQFYVQDLVKELTK